MTMPSGAAGLDPDAWLAFWVSTNNISGLANRTQANVTAHYQQQVQGANEWQTASNQFFQNIMGGYNDLQSFLHLVTNAITGQAGGLTALQSFFTTQWDNLATTMTQLGLYPTPAQQAQFNGDVTTILNAFKSPNNDAAWQAAWAAFMDMLGWNHASDFWTKIISTWFPTGASSANPLFAASGASNATDWLTRLVGDVLILLDLLHVTYEPGLSSDATTKLGTNGKRTWYSAWNDLKVLTGQTTGATTPGDGAPTIGQAVTANASNHQALADAVNQGVVGNNQSGATAPVVNAAVASLQKNVNGLQSQLVNLQSTVNGPTTVLKDTGQDSPTTGSLGPNWTTSGVNVVNRDASYGFIWGGRSSLNTPRLQIGIYNTPLATNDQVGTIILNALMDYWQASFYGGSVYQDGAPENWIILRADASINPQNYVFAKIRYADVQFGYVKAGAAPVMLGSPTSFTASPSSSYSFYAGDLSSDYNFKLVSSGKTIATYTDAAHVTAFCVANRFSGQAWKSDTDPGRSAEAAPAATSWSSYDAVASAGLPLGFGWATRLSTTASSLTNGFVPFNFYDNAQLGSGVTLPTSGNGGLKVSQAGLYTVSWGLQMTTTGNATDLIPGIAVSGVLTDTGPTFMYDGGGTMLGGGQFGMASAGVLCQSGDVISPVMLYYTGVSGGNRLGGLSSSGAWPGDSTGTRSFLKIAKIG